MPELSTQPYSHVSLTDRKINIIKMQGITNNYFPSLPQKNYVLVLAVNYESEQAHAKNIASTTSPTGKYVYALSYQRKITFPSVASFHFTKCLTIYRS